MQSTHAPVAGLVLAAGAGSRHGGPKALARDADGTSWLLRAVRTLEAAGCTPVVVVLGAGGAEADLLLRGPPAGAGAHPPAGDIPGARVVVRAEDWASGLSASLRAGLRAVDAHTGSGSGSGGTARAAPVAVAVVPVDVPDLNPATVARMIGAWPSAAGTTIVGAGTLRQARFGGRPGHPVVIGRDHWAPLAEQLTGDTGARDYLAAHETLAIECGDLGTGVDVDSAP